MKKRALSLLTVVLSLTLSIAMAELALRIRNSSMENYDIEMWRYARELKVQSQNPLLGHEHLPSREAVLQSVKIRINEWGLRGGPVPLQSSSRRILFLGSSITLGWGVREEDCITERLARRFAEAGESVEVLNAGIGNYNTPRYVERFLTRLSGLQPTDIVVHFFLRDAEALDAGRSNFVLRNSQLAVTLWIAAMRHLNGTGLQSVLDHYRAIYQSSSPGFQEMKRQLARLAQSAKAQRIRLFLAMTPDAHDLVHYEFDFAHDIMKAVAADLGYVYVDLLPALRNLPSDQLWAMPGDPHPNALGHARMAEALYPVLHAVEFESPAPSTSARLVIP